MAWPDRSDELPLAALVVVLFMAAAFVGVCRSHIARVRRARRGMDPLSLSTVGRRRTLPFLIPARWLALRISNTAMASEALGVAGQPASLWSEALSRSRERRLFISPPIDGWTLVIGAGLPDPGHDVDGLYHFLRRLSSQLGEVHFYNADRVLSSHAWARLDDGRVTRAYAWAGETLWNEGRATLEERELGLRCRAYGEESESVRYGETPAELQNMERVLLLARRWSLDPITASEILLQQEGVESGDSGDPIE